MIKKLQIAVFSIFLFLSHAVYAMDAKKEEAKKQEINDIRNRLRAISYADDLAEHRPPNLYYERCRQQNWNSLSNKLEGLTGSKNPRLWD